MAGYGNSNNFDFNVGQFFSKQLKKISNFGLSYDIDALQNSQAIGINEEPELHTNMGNVVEGPYNYDIFSKKLIAKQLDKKSIAYLDRSYFDKRKILMQYSIKDEIRDFVTSIADDVVVYDDDNMFCSVDDLPDDFDETIRQKLKDNFEKIYTNLGFNDGITAWEHLKSLLIEGFIAFEIVYDKKQKNVIDLLKLDPLTLVPGVDPESGSMVWIQYPDDPKLRRLLLDAQIIYISYGNNQDYGESSYVEPLIRPYNQLKLLEQTKLLYNINQASIYKKFIVPVGGLSRQQAEQQIYQLMSEYHEDVQWDDNLGTVTINGSSNIPHSKDFWFPSSGEGTPDITIESPTGNDLNEDLMLGHFFTILKRASRIPFTRFDKENGGGNIYNDASEMTRDEIKYHNFIRRIRTIFKELILKPVKIQTMRDFPEMIEDTRFINALNINFNSNELFEEWKYLNNLEKRSTIASTLSSNIVDPEGNPYYATEWIVRNIMKMSDEDIAENLKYKLKERGAMQAEGGEGGDMGGDMGGGAPSGPGGDYFGGGADDMGNGDDVGAGELGGGDDFGGQAQGGQAQGGQAQGGQAQGGQMELGGEE
jgi:hypothetical protein